MALWEDVKKNLVEWYTFTSEKTSEAARIGSRRWDKFGISRDIERQFSELGSLVYVALKDQDQEVLQSDSVAELVDRISRLEEELTLKNKEIEEIRRQHQHAQRKEQHQAAAAAGGADSTASGFEEPVAETIITDPVLEVGAEESAILVEPKPEAEPADDPKPDEEAGA